MVAWNAAYGKRTLEGNLVSLDALNSLRGDSLLAISHDGCDIDGFPRHRRLLIVRVLFSLSAYRIGLRTLAAAKMSFTACEISGPIPSPSMIDTGKFPCVHVSPIPSITP